MNGYVHKWIDMPTYNQDRVRTGPGNPGKSLNFMKLLSRSGMSWNSDVSPGKSWKSELSHVFY